jgi:ABC-type sugar transport system ATPase subunit
MADIPSPSDEFALEVRGLTKRFPGVLALDQVSLAVKRGEIHAVVGQNGAGKSTMINIVAGMLSPDEGAILLRGRAVEIGNTRRAIELGIATVYQELSLLPNLSVAQNIALGREPRRHGFLDVAAMRAVSVALGVSALRYRRRARRVLSLAERQLVGLPRRSPTRRACSFSTSHRRTRPARKRIAWSTSCAGYGCRGIAIIYVSHRFGEILNLCDRATVMPERARGTTTVLAGWTEARLTAAMIGGGSEAYVATRRGASGELVLEATDLAWRSRVRNASLAVSRGEILALTGLLGAGQNEVARIIGGDLRAEAGRLRLRGRDVVLNGPQSAVAAGICLLTDDRKQEGILPNLSLAANIALPSLGRRRRGSAFVDGSAERRAVAGVVERFGVVARSLATPIRTLSGGNQQKALIARWHLADADLFVLIDPTRGVDVGARAEIYRRLDALADAGKAVIVVSSDNGFLRSPSVLVFRTVDRRRDALRRDRRKSAQPARPGREMTAVSRSADAIPNAARARQLGAWLVAEHAMLVAAILLFAAFALTSPIFGTLANAENIARQTASVLVLGLGMSLVVLVGGIDLSVGSVVLFSATIAGVALTEKFDPLLAIAAAIGGGALIGALNAALIEGLRISPVIVTLGTMIAIRGLGLALLGEYRSWIDISAPIFNDLAIRRLAGIPLDAIVALVLSLLLGLMLRRTVLGLRLYAVGECPGGPPLRMRVLVCALLRIGWGACRRLRRATAARTSVISP